MGAHRRRRDNPTLASARSRSKRRRYLQKRGRELQEIATNPDETNAAKVAITSPDAIMAQPTGYNDWIDLADAAESREKFKDTKWMPKGKT